MPFKIRTKLTLAFVGTILFIISVVGVIAWYNQKALFNSLHRVEYAYTEREYFTEIRIAVEKTVMAANDYLVTGDRKERETFDRSAEEAERLFREMPYEKVCKRCHPAARGIVERFYAIKGKEKVDEMKYMRELSDSFGRIRSKGEEIFALERPVGSAAGARLMEEMDALYNAETGRIIAGYRGAIRGSVSEAIAAAQGVRGRSWLIMLFTAVILASIGLIFSRLYARSFVLPIETMHERADTIAMGDFKARVDVKSHDEIGQLAGAMNEMAAQLDSFFSDFDRQLDERTAELRESEEIIKKERDYSKSLIETAHAIILTLDTEGRIVSFNRYMEDITGYKLDEVKGKDWFTTFLPECDHDRIRGLFKEAVSGIPTKGNVNPLLTRDGREVAVEWYDNTIKDVDGKIVGLLAIGQDVTETMKTEAVLGDSEERFRIISETAADAIICMKSPGVVTLWNRSAERIFGYGADEAIGKDLHDIIVPEKYREKSHEGLKGFFKTGSGPVVGKPMEITALRRDGSEFPVELSISGMRIGDEWQAAAIIRDITERKEAEEALKASEERYRHLIESVTDYIFTVEVKDGQPVKTTHGPGCVAITGYTSAEYEADPNLWLQMVHEGDRDAVLRQAEAVLYGRPEPIEHRIITK